MFDLVFGLPMHILVVHAVVVLGPLSALAAVGYAVRPGWRRVLRWPTVVGALLTGVSAFVAAESGEQLLRRVSQVRAATTDAGLLAEHVEWGDRAKLFCLAFMVLTLAVVRFVRPPEEDAPRTHPLDAVLAAVTVLAAAAATTTIVLAGHAGSQVVWSGLG